MATGVAPRGAPPLRWNASQNVQWKVPLRGKGHSTPIVWGDRIFLTTAIAIGEAMVPRYSGAPGAHDNLPITHRHQFVVLAIDRNNGDVKWQNVMHEAVPHEGGHNSASLASASPCTDGQRVYAFFGSYGLYCLDFDGNLVWEKHLGKMHSKHGHGEGSSPVLYKGTLVVNWDHEGDSFIVAFEAATGNEIWRKPREEVTSWSTPIVVKHDGTAQVVVCGTKRVRAYDLNNGEVIWQCGGLSANIVASPVAADGVVFVGSSYDIQSLLAIRLDGARGDITGSEHVLWRRVRGTPYVPSLLLYDDSLYFLRHYQGILSRVDIRTGQDKYGPFRLVGIRNVYSSPVGAANRVYITDLSGTTLVISHDDDPRILAVNQLNESIAASAAIAGKQMFLRGDEHLYCLETQF